MPPSCSCSRSLSSGHSDRGFFLSFFLSFYLSPVGVVSEFARRLTARVVTGDFRSLGPPPARRGCSNLSAPRGGVPRMQKLSPPSPPPTPGGSPGLSNVLFFKPVVGQSNIALHAVPVYTASTYLVSAILAHSTSFSPNVFHHQRGNV